DSTPMIVRIARVKVGNRQASLHDNPRCPRQRGFCLSGRQKTNPISAPQLSRQPDEIQAGGSIDY
ncbi:hypothetical protein, partial [Burkholderia gladioli]|uniref:hypothetical protein n=1 Tax=Burkholderia gladioli TaxID=28095 RepID=UPI001ABB788E